MSEPLPASPCDFTAGTPEYAAYQSCLTLEALGSNWGMLVGGLAREVSEAAMFRFSPQVAARVLGYALIHSPSIEGKATLVQEILGCSRDGEFLAGLAYLYVMGMIRVFRNPKSSVPTSLSSHSSRASFQATADNIAAVLAQPTTSSHVAKDLALARDNYRCILSGTVDAVSLRQAPMLVKKTSTDPAGSTSLGHIFGQSTMDNTTGMTTAARAKLAWAASAAAVVERFAGISVVNELNGNDIHRPQNTFTIAGHLHSLFDMLYFSLRPIESDDNNTYEIHTYPSGLNTTYRCPDRVTLTDATNGNIPLPDRRYFQLHDACARIAHLSGAGDIVEQLLRDMEDMKVLAEDGGSNQLLSLVLSSRLQAQSVY
ncbi:hypothetical protein IW261DRAFT_1405221 [Armillaria novae-zelandiae]|uniref:HNH nuclease domain-containing protein n=1 Tax=Armillaria novae-zelandiae TaxID=153914 RepID=A0AA39T8X3_9AGAR|nr:hypothetical protein IW261DRAFT_1405221 [Armillaria novae-zelandiae]